jgi:hypothetical protein
MGRLSETVDGASSEGSRVVVVVEGSNMEEETAVVVVVVVIAVPLTASTNGWDVETTVPVPNSMAGSQL